MQEIDKELIVKAGQGDMRAFRDIYEKASGFVYSLAFRVTNRKQDAEEVTQDVFLKLYHSLRSFKFESSFKTWLYRIAVNTSLNYAKKRNKNASKEIVRNSENTVFVSPKAGREVEMSEAKEKLGSLLEALNPDQRACLVLREIDGLDDQAIAQSLGINMNTVRSRLKRAREALMALGQKEVAGHEV